MTLLSIKLVCIFDILIFFIYNFEYNLFIIRFLNVISDAILGYSWVYLEWVLF